MKFSKSRTFKWACNFRYSAERQRYNLHARRRASTRDKTLRLGLKRSTLISYAIRGGPSKRADYVANPFNKTRRERPYSPARKYASYSFYLSSQKNSFSTCYPLAIKERKRERESSENIRLRKRAPPLPPDYFQSMKWALERNWSIIGSNV